MQLKTVKNLGNIERSSPASEIMLEWVSLLGREFHKFHNRKALPLIKVANLLWGGT